MVGQPIYAQAYRYVYLITQIVPIPEMMVGIYDRARGIWGPIMYFIESRSPFSIKT